MKIVGISICSTGIAHTYMAAEALVSVAKQRGHEIKIETQGAMGFENEDEKVVMVYAVVDQRQDYLSIVRGL